MPHSSAFERFEKEADFALSRVRHYRTQGDQKNADRWHQAWSNASAAADQELLEHGGGARLLRRHSLPPLRPLPPEILAVGQALPEPPPQPEQPMRPNESDLAAALERHALIERALKEGSLNPLPDLSDAEWEEELEAYRTGGPYESGLLMDAEEDVEAISEAIGYEWPEPEDEPEPAAAAPAGLDAATFAR